MIKPEFINYDKMIWRRRDLVTDMIGDIKDIVDRFGQNVFAEVLCAHVIEHFRPEAAMGVIEDCYKILQPGGKLVMEGPDVMGIYNLYKDDPEKVIVHLFGREDHYIKFGDHMTHKWGWTRDTMAKAMENIGFQIFHVGIGMTHGMGTRDFRVEGIKK